MSFVPKITKVLTRPVLKLAVGQAVYIRAEGAIYVGKEMKAKDGDKKKEPANLMNVTNLETGEVAQIIVNAVVKSVLIEEYPDDSYVGKCFSITRQVRQAGKSYDPFSVIEIEDPNVPLAPAAVPDTHAPAPLTAVGRARR